MASQGIETELAALSLLCLLGLLGLRVCPSSGAGCVSWVRGIIRGHVQINPRSASYRVPAGNSSAQPCGFSGMTQVFAGRTLAVWVSAAAPDSAVTVGQSYPLSQCRLHVGGICARERTAICQVGGRCQSCWTSFWTHVQFCYCPVERAHPTWRVDGSGTAT